MLSDSPKRMKNPNDETHLQPTLLIHKGLRTNKGHSMYEGDGLEILSNTGGAGGKAWFIG